MLLAPFLWIFCEFDEKVLDNLSLVLPDNDTSVIRGPVIKKTGWPRGQWSGANPTPECFPFSGVPGAN